MNILIIVEIKFMRIYLIIHKLIFIYFKLKHFKRIMLKLKNFINSIKNFRTLNKDDKKLEDIIKSKISFKSSFLLFTFANVGTLLYFLFKYNEKNYDISLTRYVSRLTGRIGNTTIPVSLRKYVYEYYIKLYSVNKEEMLDKNLENYSNIKDFFTRKIDV